MPFPPSWTVRRARDAYLAENGFTVEGYDAAWTEGSILGVPVKVPNTPHHRWALMLHDLHHVATGFGTDLAGEGEQAWWEAHRGFRCVDAYVSSFVLMACAWGIVVAPRRSLAAWRASRRDQASLFAMAVDAVDYDALLELTVGDLRAALNVPRAGLAGSSRALHSRAPKHARVEASIDRTI
jgi:hypothetical protein